MGLSEAKGAMTSITVMDDGGKMAQTHKFAHTDDHTATPTSTFHIILSSDRSENSLSFGLVDIIVPFVLVLAFLNNGKCFSVP